MKSTSLLFLIIGILIFWSGGVKGNLGSLLSSIFTPSKLKEIEE